MSLRIEDYALIGDLHTAALVGKNGSIDWLCWPRFDSPSCFAAIVGNEEHGRWSIAPKAATTQIERRYIDDTLILETRFTTSTGSVSVIDFMPLRNGLADIVRIVTCHEGEVEMYLDLVLRFDYGIAVPWVKKLDDGGGISAVAGPNCVVLRTPIDTEGKDMHTVASFKVRAGENVPFTLTHFPSHHDIPKAIDVERALSETKGYWQTWVGKGSYHGPWREAVTRSLITLKALIYMPSGGMVAAPTTSLPEHLGSVRNWDYRYCWIRDATLTLLALMHTGYFDEADQWRDWLLRAVAGNPSQIQIMYGIAGERWLPELEIEWLPGHQESRPVRIGNLAAGQRQLDIFGELMDALYQARRGEMAPPDSSWPLQVALCRYLETIWQEPDDGIWESRGGREQFTFSKLMTWVAFDRAIRIAEEAKLDCCFDAWRTLRNRIHEDVCKHGFNAKLNSFVRVYDGTELDAALLLLPIVGFLPPDDPRVIGTIEAIQRHLTVDGFVLRYNTGISDDGLPEGEGVFLACSFWLADNLILQGRVDEATELFERLVSICNDVGLLSEEYDPREGRMLGNFPQAFSHIAMINTALNLTQATGPAKQRSNGHMVKASKKRE